MTQTTANDIKQRVILNLDRCIGCRSCSAACYYGHDGMPNVAFAMPLTTRPWARIPIWFV